MSYKRNQIEEAIARRRQSAREPWWRFSHLPESLARSWIWSCTGCRFCLSTPIRRVRAGITRPSSARGQGSPPTLLRAGVGRSSDRVDRDSTGWPQNSRALGWAWTLRLVAKAEPEASVTAADDADGADANDAPKGGPASKPFGVASCPGRRLRQTSRPWLGRRWCQDVS